MNTRTLPALPALLACLPAAAWAGAASAGTVTLLSQERSAFASVNATNVSGFQPMDDRPAFVFFEERESDGFEPFSSGLISASSSNIDLPEGLFFDVPLFVAAEQTSSFEQQGSDTEFRFSGRATVSRDLGVQAGFVFEVDFRLEEDTAYELSGFGTAFVSPPRFTFTEIGGPSIGELFDFDVDNQPGAQARFDFTAEETPEGQPLFPTGILEAGDYTFGVSVTATAPGLDESFVEFNNFGLTLLDTTLVINGDSPDTPVAIPSPAALPAGLALLAGGLLRRRRVA